jgi:ankyrin repeat protein
VWLLEKGADIRQADEAGVTPALAAARNNNVLSVMRLVNNPCEYGAQVFYKL